jgi:hypothetical protein
MPYLGAPPPEDGDARQPALYPAHSLTFGLWMDLDFLWRDQHPGDHPFCSPFEVVWRFFSDTHLMLCNVWVLIFRRGKTTARGSSGLAGLLRHYHKWQKNQWFRSIQ